LCSSILPQFFSIVVFGPATLGIMARHAHSVVLALLLGFWLVSHFSRPQAEESSRDGGVAFSIPSGKHVPLVSSSLRHRHSSALAEELFLASASHTGAIERFALPKRVRDEIGEEELLEAVNTPLDVVWLECDLRFTKEEAKIKKMEELKTGMQDAATKMEFEKAQDMKMQYDKMANQGVGTPPPSEQWLLRESEFPAFGKFMSIRGLRPEDVEINCFNEQGGALAKWGTRKCSNCIKHNMGGPYGIAGVASPAYPTQEAAEGCLGQSTTLELQWSVNQGDDSSFDSSQNPSSSAFCQTV